MKKPDPSQGYLIENFHGVNKRLQSVQCRPISANCQRIVYKGRELFSLIIKLLMLCKVHTGAHPVMSCCISHQHQSGYRYFLKF